MSARRSSTPSWAQGPDTRLVERQRHSVQEDAPLFTTATRVMALTVLALSAGAAAHAQRPITDLPPPVQMTAEQDHRRMMELLHITSLRPGVDGFSRTAPNACN